MMHHPTVETHPFADVLRTVGRGPTRARPLTQEEAQAAMEAILDGAIEPLQLGAFLLVLRYRTETATELSGFVRAARARIPVVAGLAVDLDWPSYADRHKQLPYFLLAALLLAANGVRVLMHGIAGEGPVTTPAGLAALGIRPARSIEDAARKLDATGFAYLPLAVLLPELDALFGLRPLLGLRTAVHTLARELNPFRAPAQIQGIFHPTYLELHRDTQLRLGQQKAVTFKGGGGEAQRNPEKPCRCLIVENGAARQEIWPALATGARFPWRREPLEPGRLRALWKGAWEPPGPVAAVTGTTALALRLLDPGRSMEDAQSLAQAMWRERPRRLPPAH